MKKFKTIKEMKNVANEIKAALEEKLSVFTEPATVEVEVLTGSVQIEVSNKNTYELHMDEVISINEVAMEYLQWYENENYDMHIDTAPVYLATTESFIHIPTFIIELKKIKRYERVI